MRVPFEHVVIDRDNPRDPHCKTLADIDGDGYPDAVVASSAGGAGLFWYDARAGWKKWRIAPGNFTTDMQAADIDRDGDLDLVIPNSRLRWFENPRPRGNPEGANPLASSYFNNRKLSIYGGSNEIQRIIVSKQMLGL